MKLKEEVWLVFGKRRHIVLQTAVLLIIILPCGLLASHAAASSKPYDVAIDYVAANDWDMALYVFDKIQRESRSPGETLLVTMWKAVILKGLASAEISLGDALYSAHYNATGGDQLSFAEKSVTLYEKGIDNGNRLAAETKRLLSLCPARRLRVSFPQVYALPPTTADSFDFKLQCGLFPGDMAIATRARTMKSYGVMLTLEAWTGDSSLRDKLAEGKCTFEIDFAKVYVALGKFFASDEDATQAELATRCLDQVLKYTEGDPYCKERLEALKLLGR